MNVTLKDFVTSFVRPNTLIRLWYPTNVSCSHESVYSDTNQVWMEHEITNEDKKHEFAESIVIGVTDILVHGNYVEAVNIVIKKQSPVPKRLIFKGSYLTVTDDYMFIKITALNHENELIHAVNGNVNEICRLPGVHGAIMFHIDDPIMKSEKQIPHTIIVPVKEYLSNLH